MSGWDDRRARFVYSAESFHKLSFLTLAFQINFLRTAVSQAGGGRRVGGRGVLEREGM